MNKTLLILGDSFACDWKVNSMNMGWPILLNNDFTITNLAQAGVSEYKIYKQLQSVDVNQFDFVIISHTSSYRIPIEKHPTYQKGDLHENCDLIFSDIESKRKTSKLLDTAYNFYKDLFWNEYFEFTSNLIYQKIQELTPDAIHMTFFDEFYDDSVLKLESIFKSNRGDVNHLNEDGNIKVYNKILSIIKEKTKDE